MSDTMQRNPHRDFKKVEASRPHWDASSKLRFIQTPCPSWIPGGGTNQLSASSSSCSADTNGEGARSTHIPVDPSCPSRPVTLNYKLLISAITPRPIAFISSYHPDPSDRGNAALDTGNLAPFSYFNVINHDPPLFTVGFASPLTPDDAVKKDTLRNLAAAGECVVNIISEDFVEAANVTSTNAPPGVDEWVLSGLTKVWDCIDVARCPRVGEAVFSAECKVVRMDEFESRRTPGRKTGTLVVLEGVRFWVRRDGAVTVPVARTNQAHAAAPQQEQEQEQHVAMVRPEVLRPVSRLGGITYGRTSEVWETPRPDWANDLGGFETYDRLRSRANC